MPDCPGAAGTMYKLYWSGVKKYNNLLLQKGV